MPEHTVLVTGGAGALGQAVISLCLALKCQVYTTVSSLQKKIFLLKLFPQLKGNLFVLINIEQTDYDFGIAIFHYNY